MNRVERPSPNRDSRGKTAIDALVLHYTGMESAEAALSRLCDPQARVSAHYVIAEDGGLYRLVAERKRAWHAGVSFWDGARDINACSIGVELVNPGHELGYRPFPEPQIESLITLARDLLARHPIRPWRILGHSDVAPSRKTDPGELFPWERLAREGIGLWPEEAEDPGERVAAELLTHLGYDPDAVPEKRVAAFQRHFRPARVDGVADGQTRRLLKGLVTLFDAAQRRRM
ncbi:MAG: N-acetylmuramoyl-L-alanine amidase [Rhizomicrobium sp.]